MPNITREDSDTDFFSYNGAWTELRDPRYHDGRARTNVFSPYEESSITFSQITFGFTVYGDFYADHGSFAITIDGQYTSQQSSWSPQLFDPTVATESVPVYTSPKLDPGLHSMSIVNLGQIDAREGAIFALDYIEFEVPEEFVSTSSSSPSASTSTNSTAVDSGRSSSFNIGAIVGGAIGGLLILAIGIFIFYRKRKRPSPRHTIESAETEEDTSYTTDLPLAEAIVPWRTNQYSPVQSRPMSQAEYSPVNHPDLVVANQSDQDIQSEEASPPAYIVPGRVHKGVI